MFKAGLFIAACFIMFMNSGIAVCQQNDESVKKRFLSRPNNSRSIWVWGEGVGILKNKNKRAEFFKVLKNPHGTGKTIDNVYFDCKIYFLQGDKWKPLLMNFIKEAHSKGVFIQYLSGDPSWGHQRFEVYNIIREVKKYNASVPAECRFDGIQLDIEPYLLPVWGANPKYRVKFFESVAKYGEMMRQENPGIVFSWAVPVFFDEEQTTKMLSAVDYLTLMNYTDNPKTMANKAEKFLKIAEKMNKKIESGIETQGPSKKWGVDFPITFYDEGVVVMEQIMAKAEPQMAKSAAFMGIAVHFFDSYKDMKINRMHIKDTRVYPVQPIIGIPYANVTPAIDGDLADWPIASKVEVNKKQNVVYEIVKGRCKGPKDLSCNSSLFWNDNGFYIAFDVSDNKITQNFTKDQMVNGDHIELWFDTDYENDEGLPYVNDDDYQIGISPGNFKSIDKSLWVWSPSFLGEDKLNLIKYASKKTDYGYIIEMFIPYEFLGMGIPVPNKKIRINIDPSDTDSDNNLQEVLMSSSICRHYGNPRSFRTAVFTK